MYSDTMSSPLSEEELESRMQPGMFSQGGFIGPEEKLEKVLADDAKTLGELGITFEELAFKLEELISAAELSSNARSRIGKVECHIMIHPGFQICPWSSDPHHSQCTIGVGVRHASVDWVIHNMSTRKKLSGPGLIVHLIRDHHFFEGRQSPYRVDPHKLAIILKSH
jgi:hypothetical protein